jgi:bacteriorhodopsin
MFQHFSGRAVFLIHASLGLVFFAYMLSGPVGTYFEAERRLQVSETDKDVILEEQMSSASRISLIFSSAFFFLLSCWLMTHITEMNFALVQRSSMGKRLEFCLALCLYITFFSALFNAIQLMDDDNLLLKTIDGEQATLDLGRIAEWMLTCPLIQLALPVLGGEKIPDSRRLTMPTASFTVLAFGFMSTISETIVIKALMYCAGILVFLFLLYLMNACISDANDGGENLFYGSSYLRRMCVLVALTWIPFPAWYALSPEGFNFIKSGPAMKIAVAFLNVLSKGSFIMYITGVRSDFNTRQKTMMSIGYLQNNGKVGSKGNDGIDQFEGATQAGKDDDEMLDQNTLMVIDEVLETMGRSKDKSHVVDLLRSHLITTQEDILALTKVYCSEIHVPWGLVLALKSKIRSNTIQLDDAWSMNQRNDNSNTTELSFSAPHIAKNSKKIESVQLKRSRSKDLSFREDMSEKASNVGGYPSSMSTASSFQHSMTPRSSPNSASPAGRSSDAQNDDARIAAIMETHQKGVNDQVDECRQFVVQSMDKIMDVLEQRMPDVKNAQLANSNHPQAAFNSA